MEIFKSIFKEAVKWDLRSCTVYKDSNIIRSKLLELSQKKVHQNPYSQCEIAKKLDEIESHQDAMVLYLLSATGYQSEGSKNGVSNVGLCFLYSMRRENRKGIDGRNKRLKNYNQSFEKVIELGELFLTNINTDLSEKIEHEIRVAGEWLDTEQDAFRRKKRKANKRRRKRR